MSWFESQPMGRIINRFSRDLDIVDSLLPEAIRAGLFTFSMTLAIFILIAVVIPIFLAPAVPILAIYYFTQRYYRRSSVELKRIEHISRSPMFAHISESASGWVSIRAFSCLMRFRQENWKLLDANNTAVYLVVLCQRWLAIRLESLAAFLVFFVALLGVALRDTIDPALIALSVVYSLQLSFVFQWFIQQVIELEMHMSSVERLSNYLDDLPNEHDGNINGPGKGEQRLSQVHVDPPVEWPQSGSLELKSVFLRYRPDLPNVLTDISCKIKGGEKVGVVGRTGIRLADFIE